MMWRQSLSHKWSGMLLCQLKATSRISTICRRWSRSAPLSVIQTRTWVRPGGSFRLGSICYRPVFHV
ncbi:rCG61406, isoform CRA_b [Rattus norvegicus]|uniref:RCG61406, isoform CRA_b n=1 Tax=Rattus norvegicus TaxID=10116 RepID=A6H9B7_RAT|nr:rCG61406, isoform CRA_b [Rattus norvegicus]